MIWEHTFGQPLKLSLEIPTGFNRGSQEPLNTDYRRRLQYSDAICRDADFCEKLRVQICVQPVRPWPLELCSDAGRMMWNQVKNCKFISSMIFSSVTKAISNPAATFRKSLISSSPLKSLTFQLLICLLSHWHSSLVYVGVFFIILLVYRWDTASSTDAI